MTKQSRQTVLFVSLTMFCMLLLGAAFEKGAAYGEMIIYPAKGQSQKKMEKDKYECYSWAKGQTGFDPMKAGSAPPPSQQPPPPGGERVKGAARGAAVGAVVGGIAGDAGKGAAAGAAGGAMIGGMKKRQKQQQQAQAQQQQNAAFTQAQSDYNRAFGACMEGRGYTIK
jgi:hypothetical protein